MYGPPVGRAMSISLKDHTLSMNSFQLRYSAPSPGSAASAGRPVALYSTGFKKNARALMLLVLDQQAIYVKSDVSMSAPMATAREKTVSVTSASPNPLALVA